MALILTRPYSIDLLPPSIAENKSSSAERILRSPTSALRRLYHLQGSEATGVSIRARLSDDRQHFAVERTVAFEFAHSITPILLSRRLAALFISDVTHPDLFTWPAFRSYFHSSTWGPVATKSCGPESRPLSQGAYYVVLPDRSGFSGLTRPRVGWCSAGWNTPIAAGRAADAAHRVDGTNDGQHDDYRGVPMTTPSHLQVQRL